MTGVQTCALPISWPEPDERAYAALSGDIAGIRAGLNQTYQDATGLSDRQGGNGHLVAAAPRTETNGHASKPPTDLVGEVRSLRDVLGEINVALKLARELPADADVGPLVDSIRTRVAAALEQSARLDTLIARERTADRRSTRNAS